MVPSRSTLAITGILLGSGLALGSAPAATASAEPSGPFCNGLEATIVGTDRSDVIEGTEGPDVIVTLARLARPGGVRSVVAESALIRHQLLILNHGRKRAVCSQYSVWQ